MRPILSTPNKCEKKKYIYKNDKVRARLVVLCMNRWTQDWQTNGHAKQITRQIYGLCIAVLSCGFLIADNIVHCRICNFQHHCLYSQLIHAMPCHATLYHVMAFDRCSSVIINSYSLAAIHSTAICFISYQQFFYLFFFFRCCFLSIWLYAA